VNDTLIPGFTSVIVVTANSGNTLLKCVQCVLANSVPLELIIVDNASFDNSIDTLKSNNDINKKIKLLINKKNIGFAAAAHQAAQQAVGDAILFLNPDCFLTPTTILELRNIWAKTKNSGLIGACILDVDGKAARVNRRREPTLRQALMTMTGLARWEHQHPAWTGVEVSNLEKNNDIEIVDAVSGALMFMPSRIYQEIGGFDTHYFLHCEDLDLCRRVRDAGFNVLFARDIRVIHEQGGSSRNRPFFVAWHKHRAMWRYFCKFDQAAKNPLIRFMVKLGIWLHFFIYIPFYIWKSRQVKKQKVLLNS